MQQNFILGKEARQWRNSRDGDGADEEGPVGFGQFFTQSAHASDILFPSQCVDHASGTQKEQRFEKRVGGEVEHRPGEGTHTQPDKHIAQLADGGIGQDFLDVVLENGDGGGKKCRGKSGDSNDGHGRGGQYVKYIRPGDHVNPGSDHGCRVDQCGNRRWTSHGIGEPGVKRYLGAFPDRTHKKQQGDGHDDRIAHGHQLCRGENLVERQRTKRIEYQKHSHQKSQVADPVHDKSLFGGIVVVMVFEPEADEEIGTEPHSLPSDEHDGIIGPKHQQQHGEYKEVHVGKKTVESRIVFHVTHRVHMNHKAYPGNNQQHQHRKRIDEEGKRDVEGAKVDPGKGVARWRGSEVVKIKKNKKRQNK